MLSLQGRYLLNDEKRSGSPSTAVTEEIVNAAKHFMRQIKGSQSYHLRKIYTLHR